MTNIRFRTANVNLNQDSIVATFNDGVVNTMTFDWMPDDYTEVAKSYGYVNTKQYTIEHELAHHFIADNLAMRYSWAVYAGAKEGEPTPPETWPNHIQWEENLVNAFQHYYRKRVRDKWNTLHCVFTDRRLDHMCDEFGRICLFIEEGWDKISYDHNAGQVRIERN